MSVFCPYCGAENQKDSKFCLKCGKPLPSAARKRESPTDNSPPATATKRGGGNRTLVWVLAAGAGLIVVGLVAVLAISWLSSIISGGLAGASVPEAVKEQMTSDALTAFSRHDLLIRNTGSRGKVRMTDFSLQIAGRGKVLPEERAQGVEEVVCYQVYMPYTEDGTPYTAVYHGLAFRTGDAWEVDTIIDSDEFRESWWKKHACPGKFEPADEHYRMYGERPAFVASERSNSSRGRSDDAVFEAMVDSLDPPPDWTCDHETQAYVCRSPENADGTFAVMAIGTYADAYGSEAAGPVTKATIVAQTPEEYRSDQEKIKVGRKSAFRLCGDDGYGSVECNVIAGYDDNPMVIKYGAPKDVFDEYEPAFEAMLRSLRLR